VTTIREVLDAHIEDTELVDRLEAALIEREDGVADLLRLAGAQFGMFPEIVAEVLVTVGVGSPISETERAMVRQQFVALMERLRNEHENGS
jgi:hypothetical protein